MTLNAYKANVKFIIHIYYGIALSSLRDLYFLYLFPAVNCHRAVIGAIYHFIFFFVVSKCLSLECVCIDRMINNLTWIDSTAVSM